MSDLSKLIDMWSEADERRLEANRVAAAATHDCEVLAQQLIAALSEKELSAAGGSRYVANLKPSTVPVASDWTAVYEYIKEHDAFDLLQKRLGVKAVSLRWDDGIEVPGVTKHEIFKLTKTKVK